MDNEKPCIVLESACDELLRLELYCLLFLCLFRISLLRIYRMIIMSINYYHSPIPLSICEIAWKIDLRSKLFHRYRAAEEVGISLLIKFVR